MLQRSSKILHPSGDILETPILVPSFSSKGFRFLKNKRTKKIKSEVTGFLRSTAEALTDTVLFSAYDLNKGFIPKPPGQISYFPQFTFIDSGGYETSEGYDLSEVYKYPVSADKWNLKMYNKVLDTWPERFPAIMVTYDHGHEKAVRMEEQILAARKLFAKREYFLHDFLIKPSRKGNVLDVKDIISNISLFEGFHIIGLTEKELGYSISERAKNIALIRIALDKVNNNASIHIFGSLDPLTSVIYFLAGAEIFDGLTWLRYGYKEGAAIYQQNYGALKFGINETDGVMRDISIVQNLVYLRNLQSEMKRFIATKDFGVFSYNAEIYKKASEYLQTLNL